MVYIYDIKRDIKPQKQRNIKYVCYQWFRITLDKKWHIALGQAPLPTFTPTDNKHLIKPNTILDSTDFISFYINRIRLIYPCF